MSLSDHADLYSRINSWTQEVATTRKHQHQHLHTATQAQQSRSRARAPARAPLNLTSANAGKQKRVTAQSEEPEAKKSRRRRQQISPPPTSTNKLRQRKRERAQPIRTRTRRKMADPGTYEMVEVRRSARERKPSVKARQDPLPHTSPPEYPPSPPNPPSPLSRQTASLQINPFSIAALSNADNIPRPLLSPSKASRSPIKRTGSPKKGDRMLGKLKTDASLTVSDLACLHPAVRFKTVRDVAKSGRGLPPSVTLLRERLSDKPGYIPLTLKSYYGEVFNTPTKSQGDLQGESYQTTFANGSKYADYLTEFVEYIQLAAEENFIDGAHERQWGSASIAPIFATIAMMHRNHVKFMNLESCSIQPIDLRPMRLEGGRINLETDSFTSNATTGTEQYLATSRMIDYGFGLRLPSLAEDAIQDAFARLGDSLRSLNQSLSYFNNVPLLLDIEIKKTNSPRAPEVQLGVWQAAGYTKRKLHGWNTKMPMPGICINGHDWIAYITFEESDDHLTAMGPIHMGNTNSIRGIWEILYKLDQLLTWGETEYGRWFQEEVMKWVRVTAKKQ